MLLSFAFSVGVLLHLLYVVEGLTVPNEAPRPILRAKVSGPSMTLHARSAKACAALCGPLCDSANYERPSGKCRLFKRCSSAVLIYNSTEHIHFSKRPLVKDEGWSYDPESDSCLKVISRTENYATAYEGCEAIGGRLAALTDTRINTVATELLRKTGAQYAWLGLTDSRFEGNPLHSDGRRVSETGWFPVEGQSLRLDPRRNCWSLSDSGTWVEHSCKHRQQFSLCQLPAFSSPSVTS